MPTLTPGNWQVTNENETSFSIRADDHPSPGFGSVVAYAMKHDVGPEQAKKNALLIAAAPELLVALKALIRQVETHPKPGEGSSEQALAKARYAVGLTETVQPGS